jgi:hypothetical protein
MSTAPVASPLGRWLAIAASIVVVATLVAAFTVMRSPSAQRKVALDQRRVQDLMQVSHAIDAWSNVHDTLPPDLATVASERGSRLPVVDPVTGKPYGYEATGKGHYRLCADFQTDTADTGEPAVFAPLSEWWHGVGYHCFERVAPKRGTQAG